MSRLSIPPPSNSLEGFHNFTQIEYYIYFDDIAEPQRLLNNNFDIASLREKSPFYYANGIFHINPNIMTKWKEKEKVIIDEINKINNVPIINKDSKNKLDELINAIPLINDSRILAMLFEKNIINQNDEKFKENFCILCEELKNTVNTIVLVKNKRIITKYKKNINTITDSSKNVLIQTGGRNRLYVKAEPVFKIDMSDSSISANNQEGGGIKNKQKGGEITVLVLVIFVEGCILCGSFCYMYDRCEDFELKARARVPCVLFGGIFLTIFLHAAVVVQALFISGFLVESIMRGVYSIFFIRKNKLKFTFSVSYVIRLHKYLFSRFYFNNGQSNNANNSLVKSSVSPVSIGNKSNKPDVSIRNRKKSLQDNLKYTTRHRNREEDPDRHRRDRKEDPGRHRHHSSDREDDPGRHRHHSRDRKEDPARHRHHSSDHEEDSSRDRNRSDRKKDPGHHSDRERGSSRHRHRRNDREK